ncbi:MAG: hypothetical protein EOO16_01090 [Chitinophagaceae bacterium]|nr:MAG: hypothetical protein EOO16_01090 [Chitinophagaceae bacterium]
MAIALPPRDLLLHEGKEHPLSVELLEPWFVKHPGKRPAGNGRGYWAQYEVRDGELAVRDLLVPDARNLRTGMRSVLSDILLEPEDRSLAHYSALLLLHPAYKGDKPAAQNGKGTYTVLEFRRGRLRAAKQYDAHAFAAFKEEQFTYFQMTDDYEVLKAEAKLQFEKTEQEARRKDPNRGYRPFDEAAFDKMIGADILSFSRELLAD